MIASLLAFQGFLEQHQPHLHLQTLLRRQNCQEHKSWLLHFPSSICISSLLTSINFCVRFEDLIQPLNAFMGSMCNVLTVSLRFSLRKVMRIFVDPLTLNGFFFKGFIPFPRQAPAVAIIHASSQPSTPPHSCQRIQCRRDKFLCSAPDTSQNTSFP